MTATLLPSPPLNAPTIHRLPGGLTIIAEQMPVEAVNFNIWLKVGSAVEPDSINGMAHFLEHMVFKGTPRIGNGEFERQIEARGAVTNAATSQEYTHYYFTSAPEDFPHLAPLQLDVVLNPSIADEAFLRERSVVLEEIRRSDDNPRRRTFAKVMETCFQTLPYRRPVLGPSSVIENLQPQQMRDFHHNWYQPARMTASVVGNLPIEKLIATVETAFGEIYTNRGRLNLAQPLQDLQPEEPFSDIVREEYEDERLQQARLLMFWRVPGLRNLRATYPLDVLAAILGQGKVSRLHRKLREEMGLVTSIGASNMTQAIQGVFSISCQLPEENADDVERAILDEISTIQEGEINESELARIRNGVANRFIFSNERPGDRANLYGYYHSQLGDLNPAFTYPEIIESLSRADIQRAAQEHLNTSAYGVIFVKGNPQN